MPRYRVRECLGNFRPSRSQTRRREISCSAILNAQQAFQRTVSKQLLDQADNASNLHRPATRWA